VNPCRWEERELHGSPSNIMWSGPRPTSVQSGILIHPAVMATTEEGLCRFGEVELGPHLTQCGQQRANQRVKFHLDPSKFWPQYTPTSQTDRQRHRETDKTDRRRSDSIGRTVS